ncbi:MAG: hypothetical protein WC375_02490 [Methanomassiliicoccales archaeon]
MSKKYLNLGNGHYLGRRLGVAFVMLISAIMVLTAIPAAGGAYAVAATSDVLDLSIRTGASRSRVGR